ncbi:MAG: hypothetical protein KIT32_12040 [Rhodocyclaceae bacterium]|nr:hypothetical protein [Rhodocyclaceae bacterium]
MPMYKWKDGARFAEKKISAQAVGERLEELRAESGGFIRPEDVVEDARSPNSALHNAFEWDDSAAAEQYRLGQARTLIRSVAVKIETGEQVKTYRAFVNVRQEDSAKYTSTVSALSDEETRRQLLTKAWNDLQAWRKKYAELRELAGVVSMLDEVEKVFAVAA